MTITIPNVKRIKIQSVEELQTWLMKNTQSAQAMMLVTYNKKSDAHYIERDVMIDALAQHGWQSTRSYTLNAHLLGHVVQRI